MEATISTYRDEFTRKSQISREQKARLEFEFYNRERKEDAADKAEQRKEDEAFEYIQIVLATQEDIADFGVKLDTYDTATVEALMQNERELTAVREERENMLLEAHTLPDGRRVFKTRDGKHVFDENGQEVKPEEVRPEQIDDRKPRWEAFDAITERQTRLVQERGDLLEYQGKLDKARERLDDPKLSKGQLDALDKELGQSMPDRVRTNLGEKAPASEADASMANKANPSTQAASIQRRDPQLGM